MVNNDNYTVKIDIGDDLEHEITGDRDVLAYISAMFAAATAKYSEDYKNQQTIKNSQTIIQIMTNIKNIDEKTMRKEDYQEETGIIDFIKAIVKWNLVKSADKQAPDGGET